MEFLALILILIIVVIGIIFLSNISLKIQFDKEGVIVIRYLFLKFKYVIYGDKEIKLVKKKKVANFNKKKPVDNKQNNGGYVSEIYKKYGIVDGTAEILSIVQKLLSSLLNLLSKCTISKLNINLKVVGDDPADAAINYGAVCAVAYPFIGGLSAITNIKKPNVNIFVDYDAHKPEFDFLLIIKLRAFKSIGSIIALVKEFI